MQMPDDIAELVRGSAEMRISFEAGNRATLHVDGRSFPARLMRLPTVVETQKSLEGTTYYKTGAVGEVLLVDHDEALLPAAADAPAEQSDGLTAPMADVRRRPCL